ncbi:MAG: chitinase [Alteromonadaceae bacterium]|jgi:chitinase
MRTFFQFLFSPQLLPLEAKANAVSSTKHFILVATVFALAACGGGGGDSDGGSGSSNSDLVINAGDDATVTEGASYSLSAVVSGGNEEYTYRWSASPSLTITNEDTSDSAASFEAPSVSSATEYTITVTVNDTGGNEASDLTIITVVPINIAPEAIIDVPEWDGLDANNFPGGVEVIFDGSSSTDDDATDESASISDYSWTQTDGTNVITGEETNLSTLTIVTPIANDAQTLSFELTVTDSEGTTDTESVTIFVQSESDTLPVVDAGSSQGVFSGETIVLDGDASTSIPSALPLTYDWERSNNVSSITLPANAADAATLSQNVDIQAIDDEDDLSTFAIAPAVTEYTVVAYTLTVTDANGNQVEDTINVGVRPMPTPLMNDTGVLQQATDNALTEAQQNEWPGQDGQRGADIVEQNGLIEKAGRGKAGFDYTRLNANGDEQDASADTWSCVRDNVTGLVWEVKTDDGTLQDKDYTYSWYSDDVNGGYEGDLSGSDTVCSLTNCNTQAYVTALNAQGLCGFYDWRMPTHQELFSLMHLGISDSMTIDEDYFPYTGVLSANPVWYWTSVPSADGVNSDDAQNAWALDFDSGVDNFLNKSSAAKVRLVRAGR